MSLPPFKSARKLANKTKAYFRYIDGEYQVETKSGEEQKIYSRKPESATLTGLALFMGFNSRLEMEDYEQNGEFGHVVSQSLLQVETVYEKKLHQQAPTGAMFALKSRGWEEKSGHRSISKMQNAGFTMNVVYNGIKTAGNEADVSM